jgi:hypothetical protein
LVGGFDWEGEGEGWLEGAWVQVAFLVSGSREEWLKETRNCNRLGRWMEKRERERERG